MSNCTDQRRPLVSVLMAARNGAGYVVEALESILNQDDVSLEFLIADDGSTDATEEVLRITAARDSRIRLFRHSTAAGLTQRLNEMLPESKGEFIARMDADDVSLPGRLTVQVARLRRDPGVGVLGTWVRKIDVSGQAMTEHCYPDSHTWICEQLSAGRNPFTHGSLIMRRGLLLSLNRPVWRFQFGQDYDVSLRLMDRTRLGIVPEVLYLHRLHSASMCSVATYLRPQIVKLALQLHADRRSGRPERDWCALESTVLESRLDQQSHLIDSYGAARRELFAGRLPAARLLLREAAQHPRLRAKASLMLALAALPMASSLLGALMSVSARRNPLAQYIREVETSCDHAAQS
jgi:GT2 family glycosyltransferase